MLARICDCCKQPMREDGDLRPAFRIGMVSLRYVGFRNKPTEDFSEDYDLCQGCFNRIKKECKKEIENADNS